MRNNAKKVLGFGDFNGHVKKRIDGFEDKHKGNGFCERNVKGGEMLLEFWDEKELCVANIWFKKNEKRKIIYRCGGNRTEIDVLVGRNESI